MITHIDMTKRRIDIVLTWTFIRVLYDTYYTVLGQLRQQLVKKYRQIDIFHILKNMQNLRFWPPLPKKLIRWPPFFITFFDTSDLRHQFKRKLGRLDNPYIVFRIPLMELYLNCRVSHWALKPPVQYRSRTSRMQRISQRKVPFSHLPTALGTRNVALSDSSAYDITQERLK